MKSVAGIVCYVKDLDKTADFYEKLGFLFSKREPERVSVRLNWFWIDFHPQKTNNHSNDDTFTYISVEDVDEFYKYLLSKGIKGETEPIDQPWGNREFVVRDPDGNQLAFFKKK